MPHSPKIQHPIAVGKRFVLAREIVGAGMRAIDGLVRDRVQHLQRRNKFAGGERLDLKIAVGDFRNTTREQLAGLPKNVGTAGCG